MTKQSTAIITSLQVLFAICALSPALADSTDTTNQLQVKKHHHLIATLNQKSNIDAAAKTPVKIKVEGDRNLNWDQNAAGLDFAY